MKFIACEICATKRDENIAVCPTCGGKEPKQKKKADKEKVAADD